MYAFYKVAKWLMWQAKAWSFLGECFLATQFHDVITFPGQHIAQTWVRIFSVGVYQI
jgi:hypothetical protein